MSYFEYPYIDDEEREIIESLNRGEWSPLSDADYAREAAMLYNSARNYFGLPPEENPVIPPQRRPLSLAELIAELPADTTEAMQHLDDEERDIIESYLRGEAVTASEGRLCEIVARLLMAAENSLTAETTTIPRSLSPASHTPGKGSIKMPTILEQYIANHAGSAERYRDAVGIFPGGVTHDNRYAEPFPLYITHGQGPRKWDVDGNEYIDYVSGHGALLVGPLPPCHCRRRCRTDPPGHPPGRVHR